MDERSEAILEAVIEEFINTGEPVSSGSLYEDYDFGIKPAMIRLELEALEEHGLLEQPHHSAGRVPTDRGYEFFAARALGVNVSRSKENDFKDLFEKRAWRDLISEFSSELGLLGVIADFANDAVYKMGLENLVGNLDCWEDPSQISAVIRDFEMMENSLPAAIKKMGTGPNVFIGKKSPVTKSDNLSVIGGNYAVRGGTVAIFAIGPKRMDYKKTIRIFKNL
jgi:transcriptional regulator of heat shock response